MVLSCTALGGWLYDDPSFALRSVSTRRGPPGLAGADSLELVFEGCNRNDYDLIGKGFRARLMVGGLPVGEGEREQPVLLATRDTSSFTITVPLQAGRIDSVPQAHFELASQATLHTPMGERPVTFTVRGLLEVGDSGERWSADSGPPCRPGRSGLPYQFERRVPLDRPDHASPPGMVGPGTSEP